jgi:lysozyme family protein
MSKSKIKEEMQRLLDSAKITKDLAWYRKVVIPKITANYGKYAAVERSTGVPAVMVAMIHARENAQDLGKFKSYLGNGQPLNRKTTIVPRGRGPWTSWEAGAIDAIKLQKLDDHRKWDLVEVMYECERYNGFGYRNRRINTPYIWAGTNHYKKGKFVRDGVFDPNTVAKNPGVFCYYKMILQADFRFKIAEGDHVKTTVPSTVPQRKPEQVGFWERFFKGLGQFLEKVFGGQKEVPATSPANPKDQSLLDKIMSNSPHVGPKMLKMASAYFDHSSVKNKDYLVLVDFDLNESRERMYVINRRTGKAQNYKVAHGTNSDPDKDGKATKFSNVPNTRQSSLGAMVLTKQYGHADGGWSKFPWALQIVGLQRGLNDKVRERAIVFHSSKYVNDKVGRPIGDTWGCFAVSEKVAQEIIDKIDEGCLLFAYHKSLDDL